MKPLARKLGAAIALLLLSTTVAGADGGVPAFRVVAPGGKSSILIGSLHVPHPAVRQPGPAVLDGARTFVIEHTTADEQTDVVLAPEVIRGIAQGRAVRADWARPLTREQTDRIRRNVNCVVQSPIDADSFEMLLKFKSARFVSDLAFIPCAPKGMLSRDAMLEMAASARHVPTLALETQDEVRRRRLAIPERVYVDSLRYAVGVDLDKLYGELADALNRGDFDAVAAMTERGSTSADDIALSRRIMIDERNIAWMPALRSALDGGDAVVLVGATHLPGHDGLLALLSRAGYRVSPTTLPAEK